MECVKVKSLSHFFPFCTTFSHFVENFRLAVNEHVSSRWFWLENIERDSHDCVDSEPKESRLKAEDYYF